MPMYCFHCKSCEFNFEVLLSMKDKSKPKCPECGKKKAVDRLISQVNILGPTSSKMDNFEYRAGYNLNKAQNESRAAQEEAAKKGVSGYRNIDDISSGMNFDPGEW